MNKFYWIVLLTAICAAQSVTAQKLVFNYDAAGNQTERRWTCVNCLNSQQQEEAVKLANTPPSEALKSQIDTDLTVRQLTVYPNPVEENLQVNWTAGNEVFLQSLTLYSVGGNKVFSNTYTHLQTTAQLSCGSLPPGVYFLVALYSDQKKEVVKIIKL